MQPLEKPKLHAIARSTPAYIQCIGLGWFPKTPGGLNRYAYELVHHLAAQHDRVEFAGVGLPEAADDSSIKLINLAEPSMFVLKRLWSIHRQFLTTRQEVKPDAINLHFALYSLPLLQDLPRDVPLTFTFHGPWALEGKQEGANSADIFFKHWVENFVYQRCDRFIVLSQAFGNILHQQYKVDHSKIHVIPGGVDTERFTSNLSRQAAREQMQWPQDRAILFTPRRLVQRMGVSNLLEAIAAIKATVPDVWLAIAGKGVLKPELEQRASELGLENHVKFLGYLPDKQLPIAYQAADLSVIPSQALEGFGLVLLESLACGTPVMCTPVGGMPEVLKPFAPDLITNSTSTADIATRLEELLRGNLTLPSRNECREYAVTNFAWTKISQQVRQVLLS